MVEYIFFNLIIFNSSLSALVLGLLYISGPAFAFRLRSRLAQAYRWLELSHLSYRLLFPPDWKNSWHGSPRRHLLEVETGLAEHPDPDFLWLERSNTEGKISVLGVCEPEFFMSQVYYFDSVLA